MTETDTKVGGNPIFPFLALRLSSAICNPSPLPPFRQMRSLPTSEHLNSDSAIVVSTGIVANVDENPFAKTHPSRCKKMPVQSLVYFL